MKKKIKIIERSNLNDLENSVNDWINEKPIERQVVSISFATDNKYIVMIYYVENKEKLKYSGNQETF